MTRKQFVKKIETQYSHLPDSKLIRLLCGQLKGHGASRNVYQCKLHPDYVVKIQYNGGFDNAIEWEIWNAIQYADWWAKWFAECVYISNSGKILIQRKINHSDVKSDYPKKVPRFFTDIKVENFGFVGDQLKACDYSYVLMRLTGFMDKKMRLAKW